MSDLNFTSNFSANCTEIRNRIFGNHGTLPVMLAIAILIPTICVMGLIGNIISFIIMKESGKKISSHFFIKILTVFDCLSLIFFLPPVWMRLTLRSYFFHLWPGQFTWVDEMSSALYLCEIRLYVTFVTRTISIYIIVAFTLERALMVLWPYKGQRWCTMRNARVAVAVVVFFSASVNLPCLFSYREKVLQGCGKSRTVCVTKKIFYEWRYAAFALLSVVPSVLISVCNAAIVITLIKRRRASFVDDSQQKERKERDREVTRRLLLVSTTFIILNTPLLIVTSAHNYFQLRGNRHHRRGGWANAFYISLLLFYVNLAINFVLYCFTGRAFRRAAFALFCCRLTEMRRQRHQLDSPQDSCPRTASTGAADNTRRGSDKSPRVSLASATPALTGAENMALFPVKEVNENA